MSYQERMGRVSQVKAWLWGRKGVDCRIIFFLVLVFCLHVCMYKHHVCSWCPWRPEEGIPECHVGLEMEPELSARIAGVLNY